MFRRDPKPENIDLVALASSAYEQPDIGWWIPLLHVEDEMARAQTGGLRLLHPCPGQPCRYASLYKAPRFADFCLMKWLSTGGVASHANQSLLPVNVRDAVRRSLKTVPVPEHYATWLTTANSRSSGNSGKYSSSGSGAMRPKSAAVVSMMGRLGSAIPSSRRVASSAADNPPPPLPRNSNNINPFNTPPNSKSNGNSSSVRARSASASATRRLSSSPAVLAQQALVLPPMLPQLQQSPLHQSTAITRKQQMLQQQQEIAMLMSAAAIAEQRRLHVAMDTRTLAYLDVMHPPVLMTPTKPIAPQHAQSGGNNNNHGSASPMVRKLSMSGREMKTAGGYLDF